MKRYYLKALDIYIDNAFVIDAILGVLICVAVHLGGKHLNLPSEKKDFDNLFSSISSTAVSFAGFILASLTIIVTVKANIKVKELDSAINGMELLLSTNNYRRIVSVFKTAIFELVIILVLLYGAWAPILRLSLFWLAAISIIGILIISLAVLRALLVLFGIIYLEFHKIES